jgi:hypothetical protein
MSSTSRKAPLLASALTLTLTLAFAGSSAAYARHHDGNGSSGTGIVPVHGSPPLNGGVLVTHGNLKFTPVTTIVRDHRPGVHWGICSGYLRGSDPADCAPGGIIGGKPADPPYGGLPQGGTVRDHRS